MTRMEKLRRFCCASKATVEQDIPTCPSRSSTSTSADNPWEVFTLKQILQATSNFHECNKLGEGGFGTVYHGRIAAGGEIAVKRLKAMTPKAEMEFAVEVEVLGRVRHRNLLGLRGYYAGGDERLIIYDYMPNHSLLGHLHGRRPADKLLDWRQRMRIALGSASGIAYLHHEVNPHRAPRYQGEQCPTGREIPGESGRLRVRQADAGRGEPHDLEGEGNSRIPRTGVRHVGKVSESCDVYSFGILLLEIVSARKPLEKLPDGTGRRDILQWALPLVEGEKWEQIADPRLGGRFDPIQLRNVVVVAIRCTDGSPENRPTMREVVELLWTGIRPGRANDVKAVVVEQKKTEEEEEEVEAMVMIAQPSDGFSSQDNFVRL
ncbi:hypothetical protein HPP92_025190 [Vanilla planifolia]|uniref:Protein kinase domain-containing protein n=1 Tax=Vanilla planifolia TaxID=51239 RepID=A0A835PKI0_VANPL|nr:hypothetical protein HPP92_025190 [Vanilla planifolia]